MKTTEETNSTSTESQEKPLKLILPKASPFATLPSKSVRPQRSMMRVQSLRPKRLHVATKTKK